MVILCILNVPGNNKLYGHWRFEIFRVFNTFMETRQISKRCDHGICDKFEKKPNKLLEHVAHLVNTDTLLGYRNTIQRGDM